MASITRAAMRLTRGGIAALTRLGYRILRLPAELVERDVEAAVALVRQALAGG